MQGKCCCGLFSLTTATRITLITSAVEAVLGLLWNAELLMLLNKSEIFNPLDVLISVHTIDEFDAVHGLTLAALGLNAFWLIFAIVAARGNVILSHGHMTFWDILTYLITLFDMGCTIFFAIRLQSIFAENPELYIDSNPTKTLTYLTLLIAFSKGGILLFVNLYLAHIIQLRGKEIDHEHSSLALYIISHIARCNRANEMAQHQPGPPPAYASSCPSCVQVPPCTPEGRSDSNSSQWSLSAEAIQGMSHDPPKYFPNVVRNHMALARALSRDPCTVEQILNMNTTESSVLPY